MVLASPVSVMTQTLTRGLDTGWGIVARGRLGEKSRQHSLKKFFLNLSAVVVCAVSSTLVWVEGRSAVSRSPEVRLIYSI